MSSGSIGTMWNRCSGGGGGSTGAVGRLGLCDLDQLVSGSVGGGGVAGTRRGCAFAVSVNVGGRRFCGLREGGKG
jgi:hypothetical protein